MVIGAAVLLLIASFLEFYSYDCNGALACPDAPNGWDSDIFPVLPSIFLAGLIATGLILAARFQPAGRNVCGLTLEQWGGALAATSAWAALWTIIGGPEGLDAGIGQILGLIAALALAAGALLTPRVPALKAPLVGGAPTPAAPAYGGPAAAPQQQGYGYPNPNQGGQPGAPSPYGQQQPFGQAGGQPAAGAAAGQPAPAAGGSADFAPFWFAVPVTRPLYAEDGSSTTIAELAPGTWYLAVEQRGQALVAQTQDGRRGVLQDTSGIQRG